MSERWAELEKKAGIRRTVAPAPTQNDVSELTRKQLMRSPFWRRKKKR